MLQGQKVRIKFPKKKTRRVWIHCASLGEFEQAKPIIERLKYEGNEIVLSFFSPSGYEQKKTYDKVDWVIYLPFDSKYKVSKFLREVEPDLAIFVKYEFWWNYVNSLIEKEIPFIFVSVVLRKDHYLFRNWALPFLDLLRKARFIYLIDQDSYSLLEEKVFTNIKLSGDTRTESILARRRENVEDEVIKKFVANQECIIFGSTYPIEHAEIARISDDLIANYKLIIFPHNINLRELQVLKDQLGKHTMLYTELKQRPIFTDFRILIVDTIGLLKDAYQYASLAYIGGGLTSGLHNTLEPFVYEIPLIFGSKYDKFPEARYFAKQNFVQVIEEVNGLREAILTLSKLDHQKDIKNAYSQVFEQQGKASTQIISDIKNTIWKEHE